MAQGHSMIELPAKDNDDADFLSLIQRILNGVAPEPLDRWSKSAAFIWYSGNTITNRAGSLMFYLSGAGGYAWYASFRKNGQSKVEGERRTARRELATFEERGRQLESVG
jgi:hypothetical protein